MSERPPLSTQHGSWSFLCGSVLALILAVAPFAYACTRIEPLTALGWSLHGVTALWVLTLVVERRTPSVNLIVVAVAGALITYAWVRLLSFKPEPISGFTQNHFSRIYDRWPESVILRTPATITLLASGLLGAFLVTTDLTRQTPWRKVLLFTMVGSGCGVVFIGLLQNATRAPGIYWEIPKHHMPSPFFGPFYHFTSAGAFLNLTWPIAASLALYSFQQHALKRQSIFPFAAWTTIAVSILLGHAGHVSRFPQVIAFVTLIGLFIFYRPWSQVKWRARTLPLLLIITALGCGMVFWVVNRTGRLHDISARWRMLNVLGNGQVAPPLPPRPTWPQLVRDDLVVPYDHSHYFLRDRGAAYEFAWKSFLRRPIWGFGPGGWISAVSQYATDPVLGTFYLYLQFTHEDYLQTLIEWGGLGALCWGFIYLGAIYTGFRRITIDLQNLSGRPETPAMIVGALAALFAVSVQALIDFPTQIPANALYACILLAICWSSAPSLRHSASSQKHVHEQ